MNNSITDNGGIFIYGQDINNGRYPQTGSTSNIEVIGNTLTDTKSQWSSYIVTSDWISSPNYIWGTALDGIEVRNNSITEGSGHPIGLWPEGYLSQVLYGDGAAPYSPNGPAPATVGTNFRGKQLHKLPSILLFDHGQFGYDHLELERQRGDRTNAGCAGCQNMEHGYAGFDGDGRRLD